MNFVNRLFNRQLNIVDRFHLNKSPLTTNQYLPQSSFDALEPACSYRFRDSDESSMSPPIALSIFEDTLAVANDTGDIVLLNKTNLNEINKFNAHQCAIFDLKWRPSTTQILTCSGDRSIVLWDSERCTPIFNNYSAHQGSVKSISFYDSNVFASGGRDGSIKLWDLRSSSALKCGPEFSIEAPHNTKLPTVKSPRSLVSRNKKTKFSPIASARAFKNYSPSNVVTCVNFNPTYNNHLYSSGISDNSIKVWDIRRCRRQFQCSHTPVPTKCYSIKDCRSIVNYQGFSSMIFKDCKNGNMLLASGTDHKIYAFLNESVYPVMVFSGRYVNQFTKICSLGEDYLLSGSINGRVAIWDCSFQVPSVNSEDCGQISIENRLPIYELKFGDNEDVSLVCSDPKTMSIYNSSDEQMIYRWKFSRQQQQNQQQQSCSSSVRNLNSFYENHQFQQLSGNCLVVPHCVPYVGENSKENCDATNSNGENRKTFRFPVKRPLTNNTSQTTTTQQQVSTTRPLTSITNWLYNNNSNTSNTDLDNCSKKRLKTDSTTAVGECSKTPKTTASSKPLSNKRSMTTSNNKKSKNVRNQLRRSLFLDNRKISDFFSTP